MGNFQLSKQVDPNKIFLTKFSELEGRFDPLFCLMRLSDKNLTPIKNIAIVKGGKRIPKGKTFSFEKTKYKYFRVKDFDNCRIDNLKNISEELFNFLKRYEVKDKNLIISIAGTIGKTILFANNTDNRVILTENSAKIILISNEVTYEFLNIILQTELLQQQIMASSIQTTIPKLGIDKILQLKIPIPPKNIQANIVMKMDKAYQNKKNKETQAQNLLNSIDDYLLDELGIEPLKEIDNSLKARIFTKKLSDISGRRFDSDFHLIDKADKKGKYTFSQLKTLTNIKKGNSITSENVIDGDIPVIAGGQKSPYNHYIANYNGNVITVSASGAYAGYVWYHNHPIFASDCTVISPKNNIDVSIKYLFEYLKLKQQYIYNLQQGAAQPHIYPSDLEQLKIPLPPLEKQNQIAEHIGNIRKQAQQLQTEAKIELEQAKQEIETVILSEKL